MGLLHGLLIILISFIFIIPTDGIGYQCCGLFQMDARGSVIIEGSRPFPQGLYQAIQFRSCNNSPFAVQLWQCLANFSSCSLKWQNVMTPTNNEFTTVNLSPAINMDSSYRLGLFLPFSSENQLSVPHGVESSLAFLYETEERFSSFDEFQLEKQVNLKSNAWTRSFAKSLVFCKSTDCKDLPTNSLATIAPVSDNPYQPPQGQCCEQNSNCSGIITDDTITICENTITELEKVVQKLKRDPPTPRCPNEFVAGEYGLGSCYKIYREYASMSEAALTCRDIFYSKLLQINSKEENDFLAKLVLRNGGNAASESFWMALLYDVSTNNWYWKDQKGKYPISYAKWLNDIQPDNSIDSCGAFVVQQNANYWNVERCSNRNYFICEVPKECD